MVIANSEFEKVWDLFGKKWNLIILRSLELKTIIRFNELKQSILGISANVLSDRLDELEKFGLVKRIVLKDGPLHVGYLLNEKCENLKKILLDLDNWISSYTYDSIIQGNSTNHVLSERLLELLKNEVREVEFNFIKDKLFFSLGDNSVDLVKNFNILKNILIELYGDEQGNKIFKKLNEYMKSLKTDI